MRLAPYWKTVVAAVGTVVTALTAVLADNVVSIDETSQLVAVAVLAAATIYGVFKVENKPTSPPRG